MTAPTPFLKLKEDGSPNTYHAQAMPHLCVGRPDRAFLFGGAAFAAGMEAMVRALGKPIIYGAAQFISFGRPDDHLAFHVQRAADGNHISQAQVTVLANDRPLLSIQAALGTRDSEIEFQSVAMPNVPSADACEAIPTARILSARIEAMFELRPALGQLSWDGPWSGEAEGPVAFWARARDGSFADYRLLAEIADMIAVGLPSALGRDSSANSLDNHIRFGRIEPTDWVLCAIQIDSVGNGLVNGTVHLFHPNGRLMAVASQSMLLRLWKSGR